MKKKTALLISILMLVSFGAAAAAGNSPVLPGKGLATAMDALEQAQLETSEEPLEQALLQNEFANRRMNALENARGPGADVLTELFEELAECDGNLGLIIAGIASGKELPAGDAALLEDIENDVNNRGARLLEIVEDENMPDGAVAGAAKALENMAWALSDEKDAPPPWAEGEGDPDGDPDDPGAPDGVPPDDRPPVEKPPVGR